LADENVPTSRAALSKSYVAYGCDKKSFVLNNLIMVKEGHPLFASSYDRKNYRHGYAADFQKIPSIYAPNVNGKLYSKQELAPAVLNRLASSGMKANA
jgi:hypothetical protein